MPLTLLPTVRSASSEATPYADPELGDNIFERVSMSVYNALRFDPEASIRSLVAPDTLPPGERTTLAKQFTHGRSGLESFILSELTNPLVLVGAAMSFRWPVLDPSKYRGAANTLKQYERWIPAGMRKLLGLNELFTGTPIPKLAARIPADADNFIARHFSPVGESIVSWRKAMGRKETLVDQVRWATIADGTFTKEGITALNKQVSGINTKLASGEKLGRFKLSDFNIARVPQDSIILDAWRKTSQAIVKDLPDKRRLADMTKFSARSHGINAQVEWIKGDFFPHLPVRNFKDITRLREKWIEGMLADVDASGTTVLEKTRRFGKGLTKVKTARTMTRRGRVPPNPADLALLPEGSVSQKALHTLDRISQYNVGTNRPAAYSLRFSPTLATYSFSMGRAYSWSYLGHGKKLIKETSKVQAAEKAMGLGLSKTELLKSVFIPQLMGTTTFNQGMKALEWAGVRQVAWKHLQDPKALAGVPEWSKAGLRKLLEEDSIWRPGAAGHRISNYFYVSTLGLNLGSASQNLLQPLLTTAPLIGVSNTMKGMASVIGKIPKYINLRTSGMSEAEALKKLFPEFVKSGGELGALTTEIALRESADIAKGGLLGVKSMSGKLRDVMLGPFRASEMFNRLSTFEAAREHAQAFGIGGKEALTHATDVVNLTQLWAGGASSPTFMAKWWQPLKQFLTFPAKLGAFAAGSVVPTATSTGFQAGIGGGFNPGVLGRALFNSATAYEVAKEFADADISRSLLFGGLPLPEEQAVLSPLPVIPPLVSVVAGAAQDLATGSTENLRRSAPLLIPGGITAARLSQSYIPKLAKLLGRGYADTQNTLPDGRIPYMDSRGNLVGYKEPMELFLSNIGIPGKLIGPNGDTKVHEVERYFLNHRDKIRETRAAYLEAFTNNDMVAAEKLRNRYMEDYGSPMTFREQDWEAVQMNRFIPRLQRIAKSLPLDVRQRFLNLAHTALAGQGQKFLGVDPLLFSKSRRDLAGLLAPNEGAQP